MQIAIICEILNEKVPVGVMGKTETDIGFITNNPELNEILDYIIDKNNINLLFKERILNNKLIRNQNFNVKSDNYFIGLNYVLPEKWKILGLTECENEMGFEEDLQNIFNALVKEDFKNEE